MLAVNYRSRRAQTKSKDDFLRQLRQRTEIESFYKSAQHAAKIRHLDDSNASRPGGNPRRPMVNKENITDQEIETDLQSKLFPYMVNNRELGAFITDLKNTGSLRSFDDLFELFKSKYLIGVTRLNNIGIQALYASFVNRYLT